MLLWPLLWKSHLAVHDNIRAYTWVIRTFHQRSLWASIVRFLTTISALNANIAEVKQIPARLPNVHINVSNWHTKESKWDRSHLRWQIIKSALSKAQPQLDFNSRNTCTAPLTFN